jgi:cytidylate kinase
VYCECPLEVRAARHQQREMEEGHEIDLARARREIRDRDAADTANLRQLHGVDYHNPAYYHLVLDTHALNPDEVAEAILAAAGVDTSGG